MTDVTPPTSASQHTVYPHRLRVAIAVHIYDLIDYEVTAEQHAEAVIGARVKVPFMNRQLIGIIVEKFDTNTPFHGQYKLKTITKLFDEPALLD